MGWVQVDLSTDPHSPEFRGDPADLVDAAVELLQAIAPPEWHKRAACLGRGVELFFPTYGQTPALARPSAPSTSSVRPTP